MGEQMQRFSFSPPLNLVEEGKWLIAVTNFGGRNSVYNINHENNSFSTTRPGHWNSKSAEKTIDELNKILGLRSQNDLELHVDQVRKKA